MFHISRLKVARQTHCYGTVLGRPQLVGPLLAKSGSAQTRGFAAGVGAKADIGGPITRDISEDGAGLSIPVRSSSLGPMHLAGAFIYYVLIPVF